MFILNLKMPESDSKKPFNWKARGRSFLYAFHGLKYAFTTQHNVWIHLTIAFHVIVLGFLLEIGKTEWLLAIFAMGLVLSAECFNTAIECLVDLVSPEINEKARHIKDVAAGAVLISAVTAAAIGLIIFLPKITAKF